MENLIIILFGVYSIIIVLGLYKMKKLNKKFRRSKSNYQYRVSMWEDMKFQFDQWKSENEKINNSLDTIAERLVYIDQLYSNDCVESKVLDDEIKQYLNISNLEILKMKKGVEYQNYKTEANNRLTK